MTTPTARLTLQVHRFSNGFTVEAFGLENGDTMLCQTEEEARLYLETWVSSWFDKNRVERIREVQ